jgi:catechol 2,3-dioxygenase-like lactoylglutathione lyase family enzyme
MTQQTTAPATVAAAGPRAGSAADPAASVSKLGYVEFTTPDIDRLLEYYTSVLCFELVDRSLDQAYLTTGFDHHCVVLTRGAAHGRTTVGYEIAGSLDDAQHRIAAAGYMVSRRRDIAPGTGCYHTAEQARPCRGIHPQAEPDAGLLSGAARVPLVRHHR